MKTKYLAESLSPDVALQAEKMAGELFANEVSIYDGQGKDYVDLAVFLGALRALYMIHQSHHWQSQGKTFYGDHLLFQRLYEGITPEIDQVAEKLIGLDGASLTNYFAQMHHMTTFMKVVSDRNKSTSEVSLLAEAVFIEMGNLMLKRLAEARKSADRTMKSTDETMYMANLATPGLTNMVEGILDLHESHVYLLGQRLTA